MMRAPPEPDPVPRRSGSSGNLPDRIGSATVEGNLCEIRLQMAAYVHSTSMSRWPNGPVTMAGADVTPSCRLL